MTACPTCGSSSCEGARMARDLFGDRRLLGEYHKLYDVWFPDPTGCEKREDARPVCSLYDDAEMVAKDAAKQRDYRSGDGYSDEQHVCVAERGSDVVRRFRVRGEVTVVYRAEEIHGEDGEG